MLFWHLDKSVVHPKDDRTGFWEPETPFVLLGLNVSILFPDDEKSLSHLETKAQFLGRWPNEELVSDRREISKTLLVISLVSWVRISFDLQ